VATTITPPNRKLIERLVRTGRFNNYSEVVRYGLELVRREIEREDLSQYPNSILRRIYQRMSRVEKASEAKIAKVCARPSPGELD
jgi:Arc/MetJ-type ribon-helix-helix transcriptional regulator